MAAVTHFEIRRATPNDAAAIANVLHESFAAFKQLYTDGGFAATTPTAEHVLIRMREGPVWVALHDGVMSGTVAAVVKGRSVYIRGMAVLPSARGYGTGAALLRQAEAWAATEGYDRLFLSTTPFLSSAIRLYEGFGYRRTDEGPQELFGTPLFTMEKDISRTK
jgi:GNAT superfamily N-acetyltransferase